MVFHLPNDSLRSTTGYSQMFMLTLIWNVGLLGMLVTLLFAVFFILKKYFIKIILNQSMRDSITTEDERRSHQLVTYKGKALASSENEHQPLLPADNPTSPAFRVVNVLTSVFFYLLWLSVFAMVCTAVIPTLIWKYYTRVSELSKVRGEICVTVTLLVLWLGICVFGVIVGKGTCICYFNDVYGVKVEKDISLSTDFSRLMTLNQICGDLRVCQLYATVPADTATSVFFNAHTGLDSTNLTFILKENTATASTQISDQPFKLVNVESIGQRCVHSVLVTGLTADTLYSLEIGYKTVPGAGAAEVRIAERGDLGMTTEGKLMTSYLKEFNPDIIILGGDTVYDNALRTCYYNWDIFYGMFTLIFSLRLLSQEPSKYASGRRVPSSLKPAAAEPVFSIETVNLLKNLSGSQGPKSFLNCCSLFHKASNTQQQESLQQYLLCGVVNVEDECSERLNLYSLKGVWQREDPCIVVEEMETLSYEIPVVEGARTPFLVPSNSNYFGISQLIDSLKGIVCEQELLSPTQSPKIAVLSGSAEQAKQNRSPNRNHRLPVSTRRGSPQKRSPGRPPRITEKIQIKAFDFNLEQLMKQVRCCLDGRELKKVSRAARQGRWEISSEARRGRKGLRERSVSQKKEDLQMSVEAQFNLEGAFKEEMVAFVKIIEAEKRMRVVGQRETVVAGPLLREQERELEELTECVTSRLKSKTPYQMVGELLRNNAHISRQLGQYFSRMAACSQLLQRLQRGQKFQARLTMEDGSSGCELTVYSCQ